MEVHGQVFSCDHNKSLMINRLGHCLLVSNYLLFQKLALSVIIVIKQGIKILNNYVLLFINL